MRRQHIELRPETNILVQYVSGRLIMLDLGNSERVSRPAPHNTVHEYDDDMQAARGSHQVSSSNRQCDNSTAVSDSNGTCNPETSVESTKTKLITADSSTTVESLAKLPDKPEKTALKEQCNFKEKDTKSRRKATKEPCNTKLSPNEEQRILEKRSTKKVTKSRLKPEMNLDMTADTVSEESKTFTSKLKQKPTLVENGEPIEPAGASVKNVIKKKRSKRCLEEKEWTKKKTVPKFKWTMKLRSATLPKLKKNYVFDDTSDEEAISVESKWPIKSSVTEVSSKLDENNDAPKKTGKKDIHGNHDGHRQTTAPPTEHFVVQSNAKLGHKKQSSELVNLELKLPTLPPLFETCRPNLKNKEQPAPALPMEVDLPTLCLGPPRKRIRRNTHIEQQTRNPFEDDSISIYEASLRNDGMANDCHLDDMYNENMPKECRQTLDKHKMCILRKLFLQRMYNSVLGSVKDILEINSDSALTLYINEIVDTLRSIGFTFNIAIELIFKQALEAGKLKDQLSDILIDICVEQGDIVERLSTIEALVKYRNYHLNADIIKKILRKCLMKHTLQRQVCLAVYRDLISHISDDQFEIRSEGPLNDYIKCLRTLGLVNEAQVLCERFAVPSGQSSRNSDALADNQPSTSATVVQYAEERQIMYGMDEVHDAIFSDNVPQLVSLIRQYKDGDLTDKFLETFLKAMQESTHNFGDLFRNLCQNVTGTVFQDGEMDKSLKYVLQTIGHNLIVYSTNNSEWKQAYNVYQTLRDLYNDTSDIKNIKMFMRDIPSYIKRLLILCHMCVKHNDCEHAWELLKVDSLHTSRCWTELADQQDIRYRDRMFTDLMTGLNNSKQWDTGFVVLEYIFKKNIYELDSIVDSTIQMAVENDCDTEYIISFMSLCPEWYNRIHCHTFRVIVVTLVRDKMYNIARKLYRQGSELKIYPHLHGNEKCLVFSTHYVWEEILLMMKVFLHNSVNFMPVRHAVVITAQGSTESSDETATDVPESLEQFNIPLEIMHERIVNVLTNHITPPIRVVNKYSQLEITPAELQKHLEERRK